jgi:hypothetical protein
MLIYSNEKDEPQFGTPEGDTHYAEYMGFGEELEKRGVNRGGNALQPISTATTVRVREGKVEHTDGPFAETKEQLGGYYLLDCKDLDEALELAAKIPSAKFGSVEVRPVMLFE